MKPDKRQPAYRELLESGELSERSDRAYSLLSSCTVCPRKCGVNRLEDEKGFCRTGLLPVISSYGPHFWEEPPLVGTGGSGTIFVTHCNLACRFCQNSDISQCGQGSEITPQQLAEIMIRLQDAGCHNINIVTPSHIVPQLIRAIGIAAGQGLTVPIVYNSGGYDSARTLRLLDGIVDIYMPDAKYGSNAIAADLSRAPEYVDVNKAAIREMHRQVNDLVIENGIAVRGLLVRHLVLPENLAGSDLVLPWIAEEISPDTYVNIMDQYRPEWQVLGRAEETSPALRRGITVGEYTRAVRIARDAGLHRGFP
ncbi:radical SAM protein [Methanoregula sp.]|uniref:radical SAM protein n=1 Tax=Methanoregula sp. TaxID=2052170 RepID=UPI000CAB8EDE|nr:radical SAM protein [Methanoregula sp.]PKG32431.1 MAG: radical SAM protein [Methanoregula sp.]